MSKLFDERVALVTGASSGIGRTTALRFAEEGAAVALLGRDRGALEETSAAVEDLGASSVMVVADLNESAQCRAAVDEAVAFKGRLDVLVNVAGIIASGDLASTTEEGWAEMMRINLDCVFVLMQAALPYLQTTAGNIVKGSELFRGSSPTVLARPGSTS